MPPSAPHHPVVVQHAAQRAADSQLHIADAITAFAGSMPFVYIHAVAFACWMLFVESDPWPTLTLIVSLEAIFLSTFVMIGQNRQAEFQRAKADHDYATQEQELRLNTELTRETNTLTTELYGHVLNPRLSQCQLSSPPDRGDFAVPTTASATQMEAHCIERLTAHSEPTRQLIVAGQSERRAAALSYGGRLSTS